MLIQPIAVFAGNDRAKAIGIEQGWLRGFQSPYTLASEAKSRIETIDYRWRCCQRVRQRRESP
jgi:hypothetical protein